MKLASALLFIAAAHAQEQQEERKEQPDDTWISNGKVIQPGDSIVRKSGRNKDDEDDRRYVDLHDIAVKIWRKAGLRGKDGFDDRKYWTYGCHCFLLGDRPMSEMGKGAPVDALDVRCKAYKDCQKCVRDKHGDQCIGEIVKYGWKYEQKTKSFKVQQAADTCEADLFQCDLKLAQDTFEVKEVYNIDYHAFWSTLDGGFDNRDEANCPSNGGTPVAHECCGGNNNPYWWMNKNTHTCVDNKPVAN